MTATSQPTTAREDADASVADVLATAVEALGGQEREGQVRMAEAVARAMVDGDHLLVQAGTGTGKSLAYLVPALRHRERVVVATTLFKRGGDDATIRAILRGSAATGSCCPPATRA